MEYISQIPLNWILLYFVGASLFSMLFEWTYQHGVEQGLQDDSLNLKERVIVFMIWPFALLVVLFTFIKTFFK